MLTNHCNASVFTEQAKETVIDATKLAYNTTEEIVKAPLLNLGEEITLDTIQHRKIDLLLKRKYSHNQEKGNNHDLLEKSNGRV